MFRNISKLISKMEKLEDRVADTVHAVFDGLHPKFKPALSAGGSVSWVPISGIVVSQGDVLNEKTCQYTSIEQTNCEFRSDGGKSLTCLALGFAHPI